MSKRNGKDSESHLYPSLKKCKLDNSEGIPNNAITNINSSITISEDIWGNDFAADEIEEMDKIVSQRFQELPEVETVCKYQSVTKADATIITKPVASCSYNIVNKQSNTGINNSVTNRQLLSKTKSDQSFNHSKLIQPSQIIAGSNINNDTILTLQDYNEFKQNRLDNNVCNSTLQIFENSTNDIQKIIDLTKENKNLLSKNLQKEGEVSFLRTKLKKAEEQIEKEKVEKNKVLQEQEEKYRKEIDLLKKQNEEMKIQNELKNFELEKSTERFKLMEIGTVKLTQPQGSVADTSSKAKLNSSFSRNDVKSSLGSVVLRDTNFKIPISSKLKLSVSINNCPLLNKIPQSIFEASLPEKSVVDIHIVEKSGRSNLPILQDEAKFRIFENSELVKPLVTMINKEELNSKYFLPDLAKIIKKSESEINAMDSIPIINKIVAATRELLLNSTIVLQKIAEVMTNDDVRDMNDVYFSVVYKTPVFHSKTVCDGNAWYEKERGIEARRSLGILSYIAADSNYLSGYIAGKTALLTTNDANYRNYSVYLTSYKSWSQKNSAYEFLKMILEFVTAVRLVRRAHQFSGLISAVTMLLSNAHKRVKFPETGIDYAFKILKEVVLSRPLLQCYIPMTQMMENFGDCPTFTRELSSCTQRSCFEYIQHVMYYTLDVCILEAFVKQIQYFTLDPITAIEITRALVSFISIALSSRLMFRNNKLTDDCPVAQLLLLIVRLLNDCSQIDLDILKLVSSNSRVEPNFSMSKAKTLHDNLKNLSDTVWEKTKFYQCDVLRKGVHLLNYLFTHDPDFIRRPDLDVPISKLLHQVSNRRDLIFHANEVEAICDFKKVFTTNDVLCQSSNELRIDLRNRYRK